MLQEGLEHRGIELRSAPRHELSLSTWTAIAIKLLSKCNKCQCQTLSRRSALLMTNACIRHWINFSDRQANHLLGCQRRAFFIILSKRCID